MFRGLHVRMRLPILESSPAPAGARLPQLESGPRSISAVRMLRISLTDRCNFRCVYCMPAEGVAWLPREEILSFEEIVETVAAAAEVHGIRRIKLTGGEPTVRRDLVPFIRRLREAGCVDELSMTTNGSLLEQLAHPLAEAGLDRVTVSIDSLKPDRFRQVTRTGDLQAVMRGMIAADRAGLRPVKINCVTMRGVNDDEVADFAALTLQWPFTVRFIEYMPLGDAAIASVANGLRVDASEIGPAGGCGAQNRGADAFISEHEVRQRIEAVLGPLEPVNRESEAGVGPAKVYRLARGNPKGRIGFISAMSQPFCSTCNRLRLTATGVLRSCLFEGGEVDLKPILRAGGDPSIRRQALAQAMIDCVRLKPDVHSAHGNEQMSRIGG